MAKYRVNTPTFIAPSLLPEGTVFEIGDDWPPGPHVDPLDDAAHEAFAALEAKRKDAGHPPMSLHPIEALPNHGAEMVVLPPEPVEARTVNLQDPGASGSMDTGLKLPEPGLADGGTAKPAAK